MTSLHRVLSGATVASRRRIQTSVLDVSKLGGPVRKTTTAGWSSDGDREATAPFGKGSNRKPPPNVSITTPPRRQRPCVGSELLIQLPWPATGTKANIAQASTAIANTSLVIASSLLEDAAGG